MDYLTIENQMIDCYYDNEISKFICDNVLSKLKRFELEKNQHHRPKRNNFLYWEDSCSFIDFENEISLCIELHYDNHQGVSDNLFYIMTLDVDGNRLNKVLDFKCSNLPPILEADYIYSLRQLMTYCYSEKELIPKILEGIKNMKREMSFRDLGID